MYTASLLQCETFNLCTTEYQPSVYTDSMQRYFLLFLILLSGLILSCEKLKGITTKERIAIKAKRWYKTNYEGKLNKHPLFSGSPDWENAIVRNNKIYVPLSLESNAAYKLVTTIQTVYAKPFLLLTQNYDLNFKESLIVFFDTTAASKPSKILTSSYYALYDTAHTLKGKNLPFRQIREMPAGYNYEVENTCECDSIDVFLPIVYDDGIRRNVLIYSYERCFNYLYNYRAYARGGTTSDFGDFLK